LFQTFFALTNLAIVSTTFALGFPEIQPLFFKLLFLSQI